MLMVPVSWGELIDKITILTIKREKIRDLVKQRNVVTELELLIGVRDLALQPTPDHRALFEALEAVNRVLWDIEDAIRGHEARQDFGPEFIALARSVYRENDRRSAVKRQINELLGSDIVEEKQHPHY